MLSCAKCGSQVAFPPTKAMAALPEMRVFRRPLHAHDEDAPAPAPAAGTNWRPAVLLVRIEQCHRGGMAVVWATQLSLATRWRSALPRHLRQPRSSRGSAAKPAPRALSHPTSSASSTAARRATSLRHGVRRRHRPAGRARAGRPAPAAVRVLTQVLAALDYAPARRHPPRHQARQHHDRATAP